MSQQLPEAGTPSSGLPINLWTYLKKATSAFLASQAGCQAEVRACGDTQLVMHLNVKRTDEADTPRDEDMLAISAHCGDFTDIKENTKDHGNA